MNYNEIKEQRNMMDKFKKFGIKFEVVDHKEKTLKIKKVPSNFFTQEKYNEAKEYAIENRNQIVTVLTIDKALFIANEAYEESVQYMRTWYNPKTMKREYTPELIDDLFQKVDKDTLIEKMYDRIEEEIDSYANLADEDTDHSEILNKIESFKKIIINRTQKIVNEYEE